MSKIKMGDVFDLPVRRHYKVITQQGEIQRADTDAITAAVHAINTHDAMQARIVELESALKGFNLLIDSVKNEQLENWFDALSNHSDHCREALEQTT